MKATIHAEDLTSDSGPLEVTSDLPCITVREAAASISRERYPGLIILVNGKLAQWETELHDGDVVELIPALGGG